MDMTRLGNSAERHLSAIVAAYYQDIDRQDVDAALACFTSDAVYRRPGYEALTGIDAIANFYRSQRVIGRGRHDIESIVEGVAEVAVRGSFRGESRAGDALAVRFADFWCFSDERRVVERNTYFDAAAV
jgi:ketosteroid isomerase-like protein